MKLPFSAALGVALSAFVAAQTSFAQQPQQQPRPPASQPAPAPAAPAPAKAPAGLPPKGMFFVIVDMATIWKDSQAGQSVRGQFEKQRNSQQAEFAKMENDLRTADEDLGKQRAILAPEAFNQRRRDLEKRIADAQQSVQTRRRDLDESMNEASTRVMAQARQIAREVAQENEYQAVLPSEVVVAVNSGLDITGEVIKRLNQKLPTVNLTASRSK